MDIKDDYEIPLYDMGDEPDQYSAVQQGDIVGFIYHSKMFSELIHTIWKSGEVVDKFSIKHLDGTMKSAVVLYNVRGGKENDAIESLWCIDKLMPTLPTTFDEGHETTYVTIKFNTTGDKSLSG